MSRDYLELLYHNDLIKKCCCCLIARREVAQSCPTLCDPMDSSLHQAPPSMGFSKQEYWSGLPIPSPGDLPDPGIEPGLPHCRQTLYHLSHQGSPVQLFHNPMDCSPPGSSVHGISQTRILEQVVIFFSRGPSQSRDRTCVS